MLFQSIEIKIFLSESQSADLPKESVAEMRTIDGHSDAIDRTISEYLDGIRADLESLGYKVEVDESA